MTVLALIKNYRKKNGGPFFDAEALEFYGEKLADMYVCDEKMVVDGHDSWILRTYQQNAPGGGCEAYFAFDAESFEPYYMGNEIKKGE